MIEFKKYLTDKIIYESNGFVVTKSPKGTIDIYHTYETQADDDIINGLIKLNTKIVQMGILQLIKELIYSDKQEQEKSEFVQNLEKATEIVRSWPKWKQKAWGRDIFKRIEE